MENFFEITDYFFIPNGNLVIIGPYENKAIPSEKDIKSFASKKIIIHKPNGDILRTTIKLANVSTSLSGSIIVAVELPDSEKIQEIPRGSLVFFE